MYKLNFTSFLKFSCDILFYAYSTAQVKHYTCAQVSICSCQNNCYLHDFYQIHLKFLHGIHLQTPISILNCRQIGKHIYELQKFLYKVYKKEETPKKSPKFCLLISCKCIWLNYLVSCMHGEHHYRKSCTVQISHRAVYIQYSKLILPVTRRPAFLSHKTHFCVS